MAYNFKNLADVELLSAMPETANVLVEVDGATKRAPQMKPVDEIEKIVTSEALTELPETGTVLAEVNGEIKRVPSDKVGGAGTLDEMPGVILFTGNVNARTAEATPTVSYSCNKTFEEALNMIKNGELRLVLLYGMLEGYVTVPLGMAMPINSSGVVFDDTATAIEFSTFTSSLKLYLLNDNTVTDTNPYATQES